MRAAFRTYRDAFHNTNTGFVHYRDNPLLCIRERSNLITAKQHACEVRPDVPYLAARPLRNLMFCNALSLFGPAHPANTQDFAFFLQSALLGVRILLTSWPLRWPSVGYHRGLRSGRRLVGQNQRRGAMKTKTLGFGVWAILALLIPAVASAQTISVTSCPSTVAPGGTVKVTWSISGGTGSLTHNHVHYGYSSSTVGQYYTAHTYTTPYTASFTAPASGTIYLKADAIKGGKAFQSSVYTVKVVAPVVPLVTGFTGTPWPYPSASFPYSNPQWLNYLQAGYAGYTPIYIYANGSGLDKVTAVSTTAPGYTIAIVARTASRLTLDIRGAKGLWGYFYEDSPRPVANMPLTFSYPGGLLSKSISPGVIPAFNPNLQAYGQCTWYAGYIARIRAGKAVVSSYSGSGFVTLNGDPNHSGFPKVNSVLNSSGKHMSFLETFTTKSSTKNADGSVTVSYTMTGSQYNASSPWGSKSSFTTQMVVNQKNGAYTITGIPRIPDIVGYSVTAVKQ